MAKVTGLSESYLGRLEKDRQQPSKIALEAIARALSVQAAWLASGQGHRAARDQAETVAPDNTGQAPHRSWIAALEPALSGSPLAGALPQLTLDPGDDTERAWQQLSEDRKGEIRDTLRLMASVATIIASTLPQPIAEKVNEELADQVHAYLADAF